MSYFDDYVADGLCCEQCGTLIGGEPGYVRLCYGCENPPKPRSKPKKAKTSEQDAALTKGNDDG